MHRFPRSEHSRRPRHEPAAPGRHASPGHEGPAGASGAGRDADLDDALAAGLARVEEALQAMLASDDPDLDAVARQVVGAGGKRLRPRLMLLAHAAASGTSPAAAPRGLVEAAAGVELIHAASLVHDDVIDRAATRRGAPAVQAEHGAAAAIVAGDFLFIQGFALAGRQDDAVVALTAQACRRLAEGELLELRAARDGGLDLDRYLRIVEGKTAALLENAARIGAHLAGRDDLQDALGAFGRHLGIAFQVGDDLLDLRGDPALTGKPRGTDLRTRAPNAGVLMAARNGARARLERFLAVQAPTEAEVTEALEAVLASGAVKEAERLAEEHVARALAALEAVPEGEARRALADLARQLHGRAR